MTIATEKIKNATQRFSLVRLKPGRYLPGAAWTSIGGNLWTVDFSDIGPVINLFSRGNDLGPAVLPGVALTTDGDWSWIDGILTLYASVAPVDNDFLVAFYYLFFTSEKNRSWHEDPDDNTTDLRNWEPRLMGEPAVQADFSNVRNGIFTIAESSVSLANTDGKFEKFLTPNDSFYGKEATVWLYINGFGNGQRVFAGTISRAQIDGEALRLSILAKFARLNTPAYAGATHAQATAPTTGTQDDQGKPLPLIVARDSWFKFGAVDIAGAVAINTIIDGLRGFVKNYDTSVGTSVNRTWQLCRNTGSLRTQTFGSITRVATDAGIITVYYFKFSSYTNLRPGDTISWTTGGARHALILGVGAAAFTYLGNTYDVVALEVGFGGSLTTGSIMVPKKTLGVFIFNKTGVNDTVPMQDIHYTITETTVGSYKRLEISFINNFEAAFSIDGVAGSTLNPAVHTVRFWSGNGGMVSHGAALQALLEDAGLTCNAASFAQADSDLPENLGFSIPNIDETRYSNYIKYVQDILTSALSYLYVNDDGEIVYSLLFPPVAGDTKDENRTLQNSVTAQIGYQDIVSALIPRNPHRAIVGTDAIYTFSSEKAEFLHGIQNEQPFRHVMEGVFNLRGGIIANLQAEPQIIYSYQTSTDDIDSILGQDVTLESPRILGGGGTKDVKIIGVEKSAESTVIRATDLQGL